jgi:hypothetical protein
MKSIFATLALLICSLHMFAQRVCESAAHKSHLMATNPAAKQAIENATNTTKNTRFAARDTSANELIIIPVVIHVLYNDASQNISDAQIKSQIESLNKDFNNQNTDRVNTPAAFSNVVANCRIKFAIAQVDPLGKRTTGIERKFTNTQIFTADDAMKVESRGGIKAWNSKKYLNIWICALNSRSLGYATSPGSPADIDGVVIAYDVFGTIGNLRAPFNKGRTATHEIGHWLGLSHTWGDDNCGDDGIYDTPRQKTYNFGCPSFPKLSTCSETANGDMYMNFMDFTDDACMNMFTIGQKQKMRSLFANNKVRNEFLTSFAYDSTLIQNGPVAVDTSIVTPPTISLQAMVYPNPVQNNLNIEFTKFNTLQSITINIYNAIGACVYCNKVTNNKSTVQVAHLKSGMYTLVIADGKSKIVQKLIKQ